MTAESQPLDDREFALVGAAGLLMTTLVCYTCVLGFGFVFDDHLVLPHRPDWIWWPLDRYLLTTLSFYVSDQPSVQHAINLLIHLVNGAIFYALLERWRVAPAGRLAALAIFLLHPLQVETVCYVSGGRPELLICLGFLVACCGVERAPVLSYLWDWWKRPGTALILLGMAIMAAAKPSGVLALVPLFFVAHLRRPLGAAMAWLRWPVWLAVVVVATNYVILPGALSLHGWDWQARAALQVAGIYHWLVRLIVPGGFTADHNVQMLPALEAEILVVSLLGVASYTWRLLPHARLLIAWLALTLGWRVILPGSEWLGEGDGYLAMLGVAAWAGVQIAKVWEGHHDPR